MDRETILTTLQTRLKVAESDGNPTEQSFLKALYDAFIEKQEAEKNETTGSDRQG